MSTGIVIICPKCKAKLKCTLEKFISDVVKFKCPGCATLLRIKKPAPKQDTSVPISEEAGRDESSGVEDRGEHVHSDLRKSKRFKFKQKVLVDNQIMVEALDISEGGLFLHTGRSFETGSIVGVGIPTMPGNFDLKILSQVRHNHSGIGMGMKFVDINDKQKAMLEKLINSLDGAAGKDLEGRKKILLVGGSDTARNINKSKLVLDGFYVMQATTVDEVYKILQDEKPDAMVLEWQETKFNCKGLLNRIKEDRQFDSVIIIVFSALTDADVHRDVLDAGADRCIAKMDTNPVKLSQILSALIEEREG